MTDIPSKKRNSQKNKGFLLLSPWEFLEVEKKIIFYGRSWVEPNLATNELLDFVLENRYFNFHDTIYKQIYSLAMGNCLSPVCTDIGMSKFQNTGIDKLPCSLPFYKRYDDDFLPGVPKYQIYSTQEVFNSFSIRIQLAIAIENHNRLAFLHISIIRTIDNKITTGWYHKGTFSERFLNFISEHSLT